jgi:hypothetical protein
MPHCCGYNRYDATLLRLLGTGWAGLSRRERLTGLQGLRQSSDSVYLRITDVRVARREPWLRRIAELVGEARQPRHRPVPARGPGDVGQPQLDGPVGARVRFEQVRPKIPADA